MEEIMVWAAGWGQGPGRGPLSLGPAAFQAQ